MKLRNSPFVNICRNKQILEWTCIFFPQLNLLVYKEGQEEVATIFLHESKHFQLNPALEWAVKGNEDE